MSGHTLRVRLATFTQISNSGANVETYPFRSSFGNKLTVVCNHDGATTTPIGQLAFLSKHLRQLEASHAAPDRQETNIYVIGDSNAHSLCQEHVGKKEVLQATIKLVHVAKRLSNLARTRVVWVGPGFISRSYTMRAHTLHHAQAALWHAATENSSHLIVEQWDLTKPVTFSQSSDGLHYHDLLPRVGKETFQIAGPAPVNVMKMVVNGLMNSIELTLSGVE
jgi:hypothetical protein